MSWFSIHNHSHVSNFRLKDSVNRPESIIDEAIKKGLEGIALTDHETLAGTLSFWNYYEKLKKENKLPEGFKIGIGNEIYLVDKSTLELVEANEKIRYNHFLLLAKNQRGYDFLKKQSSKAWKNSYYYRGMERVPTYKDELFELMSDYKGDVIASSACVGGELPQLLLELERAQNDVEISSIKKRIHTFITFMVDVFGKDDFYLELQPSYQEDQLIVNKWLPKIGAAYGLKCIVSTDAHYLNKEQTEFHKQYLTSSEGEREVESFYSTTYIFSEEELREYFTDELLLNELIANTLDIKNKMNPISFKQDTQIPIAHIPNYTPSIEHLQLIDEDKYPHIHEMTKSKRDIDRYYAHLCIEGMVDKKEEFNDENLSRVDLEFGELLAISYQMNQPMTSYFVLMKEFVDLMWKVSLVGVSRGSAACYYTNYLLDIVQINPIKYNLPHWRFLTKERPELPDIDVDSESSKRKDILALVKENYGDENVLNIGTYTTEGPRSATLTACRSIGIDTDTAANITNMLPNDKGVVWPLYDAFFGNEEKNRKPSRELIDEVSQYPGLKELMIQSQGLISGRGMHASGLVVFPNGYVKQNAMMKTTSGLEITQYDADDTSYMGGLKYDFLSINALDRIRTSMDLLLKENKIQWQGSLKETYKKYLHPDVLEMNDPKMYKLLFDGEIISAFQFETVVGRQTLEKIEAENFDEIAAANSLMRLSTDGEQPIDRYVRYKKNPQEWESDMILHGLSNDEREILHNILDSRYGVCDTQELLMTLSMDEKISGFNLTEANKLRKSVAKKDPQQQASQKDLFYESGRRLGTRDIMLDYVWNECFKPTFGYAFSLPHIAGYSLILMIEMNIAYQYGPIFWKTACLTIESGILGEQERGTNYGATAKALERFKDEILPPSLSMSDIGFTPDLEKQKILYGLKPITDVNIELAKQIISNRPYNSMDDFYVKNVENGILTNKKMVTLIKSGLFDEIDKDRRKVMFNFVSKINPNKDKLTLANVAKMFDRIPDAYSGEKEVWLFNKEVKSSKNHNHLMNEYLLKHRDEAKLLTTNKYPDDHYYDDNGNFVIEHKVFEKLYKKKIERLSDWLKTEEALNIESSFRKEEYWRSNCLGSIPQWEMQSISFYMNRHELDDYNLSTFFNISNFYDMDDEPIVDKWRSGRGGKKWPVYKTYQIAGTVVDTLPSRGIAIVITQFGVVQVRIGKGKFQHYNKKIMEGEGNSRKCIDDSWFKRGTKIVCIGYRRNNDFMCNSSNSTFNHSVLKINGMRDGVPLIQQEKLK